MEDKKGYVLITGCNGGFGRALIREFALRKNNIIALCRTESQDFNSFIRMISDDFGIDIIPVFFDLTDRALLKSKLRPILSEKIPIKALVNNAAMPHGGLFQMTSIDTIKSVFDLNLFAQMEITQFLLRYMSKNGGEAIVNVASIAGIDLKIGNCAYGVSKAALIAFTKVLSSEAAQLGIRVNAVAPGLTDTGMAPQMESKSKEEMIESSAMKRMAKPEEIAKTIVFLCSNESSFINGEVIRIDGGQL